MAVCSTRSVQVDGFTYGKELVEFSEPVSDYQALYNLLLSRRSVRNFKSTPVASEIIEKIIAVLNLTPYGSIHDGVEVTIVHDKNKIDRMLPYFSDFYDKIDKWMSNSFMRFMMKRKLNAEKFNTIENHLLPNIRRKHYNITDTLDNVTRSAPAIMVFHAPAGAEEHTDDSLIYVTYAAIAAHSVGLGATINGLIPPAINKTPELRKLFNIPENHEAVASLIFGYPKIHYNFGIVRKRLKTNWI